MEIAKRIDICRSEYAKNGRFKEYIDKYTRVEGSKEEAFQKIIVYDICEMYRKLEEKGEKTYGKSDNFDGFSRKTCCS